MRRFHIAIASWLAGVLLAPAFYMAAMPCCPPQERTPTAGAHCHGMAAAPMPGAAFRAGHGCPNLPCCCTATAAWSVLAPGAEASAPVRPPALRIVVPSDQILLQGTPLRAASVRGPPSLLTS